MAVSQNTKDIFNFLMAHKGEDMTAADIADAMGLSKRTVDGVVTSGLARKGLAERVLAEVQLDNGLHEQVKLIRLTPKADGWDFDAAEAAKAE